MNSEVEKAIEALLILDEALGYGEHALLEKKDFSPLIAAVRHEERTRILAEFKAIIPQWKSALSELDQSSIAAFTGRAIGQACIDKIESTISSLESKPCTNSPLKSSSQPSRA